MLEERLPNGLITSYAYDGEGNLLRQWDNSGRETFYRYDGQGNRVEMRVRLEGERYGVYRFAYDTHGRLVELTDPNRNSLRYSYTGGCSSPSSVTLPDGREITYTYDAAGRCLSVRSGGEERRYSYNNLDFLCQSVDPMGLCTRWEFDRLGNLIRFVLPNQADGAAEDGMGTRYYYDAMDKLVARVDSVGSVYATQRDSYGNVRKEINPNTYDRATQDGGGSSTTTTGRTGASASITRTAGWSGSSTTRQATSLKRCSPWTTTPRQMTERGIPTSTMRSTVWCRSPRPTVRWRSGMCTTCVGTSSR